MRHPRPTAPRNRLGPCHSERSEESRSEKLTLRDSCLTSFGFAYGSSERQQVATILNPTAEAFQASKW